MRICIVGLGLMGASLAYALRGFRDAELVGVDIDAEVCRKAVMLGVVVFADTDVRLSESAELVIYCVYPHHIPALMSACKFKNGTVISDICGVKSDLYSTITLQQNTDYVGIHPMAGKERDGFDNADGAIFRDTGFIITPLPTTKPSSVELMRDLARYIGATKVAVTEPSKHDEIIAYTSDLMHVSAAALCINFHCDMSGAYTAGAFRDCTRVADINAAAWAELLTSNRENTVAALDKYIGDLVRIRGEISENNSEKLCEILRIAGENKREMLTR
ncbi:prephenate dehydrogenase [Clostridia bacterium]|nr:prephenate dehydrogenase [Clostridia bacterium]